MNVRLLDINSEKKGHRRVSSISDGKSKLPGLKINSKDNEDGSQSPNSNKVKVKELSKVYKLNIGNIDELNERYQLLTNKIHKRDSYKDNYMIKNQSIQNNNNSYLENGVNNGKYYKHEEEH